ncbi:MAG: hypothetical protein EOO09_16960 [Chitinophagaceae bacterium]|nr:MAG: hypothetical protein EOO09_16960 [Chitinophagaceae bacterium]
MLRTLPATDFLTIQKRRKENSDRYPAILPAYPQQPFFSLLFLPDRKATLTLRTFEDQDGIQAGNFREFVDSAFDEIVNTGVRDLIIDIRMNNGGPSANAAYLYSWLTEQSFPFVHSLELTPAGLARLQTNRLQFVKNRITGNFTTMDTATTTVPALFGLGPQTPQKTPYLGKLIVLVDGLTASGGPQFASLVVRNKRGLVRGEETSGALAGGSGRMYTAFALPNTQLEVVISMVRIHFTPPSSSKPDENVKPDVELKRDYRAGFKLE